MARPRKQGHYTVRKALANGEIAEYHYARRGGPRILDPKSGEPLKPGTKPFKLRLAELSLAEPAPPKSEPMVADLVAKFMSDPIYFGKLGEKTKRAYSLYLELIRGRFGDMPLDAVNERGARSVFLDWRNEMAETPRKADFAWTVLKRLFNFGADRQMILVNPCLGGGRLYSSDRADKVWPPHLLEIVKSVSKEHEWRMVEFARWTGQRKGDLLDMKWDDYDGETIRVEQNKSLRAGKTGTVVYVPVLPVLKAVIDATTRRGPYMLVPSKGGEQWTDAGSETVWQKMRGRAIAKATKQADKDMLADLHFHDLRGTFILALGEADATAPQIASVTGHKIGYVQMMLDRYLPKTKEQAAAGMAKLLLKMSGGLQNDPTKQA